MDIGIAPALRAFAAAGADELLLTPCTNDPGEVDRLAELAFGPQRAPVC